MFCTIADIENFLQLEIDVGTQLDSANRAIMEATEVIRNYCDQYISHVVNDVITVDGQGGGMLYLPELPVLSVSEVIEDGDTLTQATDYILGQHGILHRLRNIWSTGVQNISVTYSHGYSVIPVDIVGVCTRAAARAYQSGLTVADTGGMMGLASYTLGDFSISLRGEHGGGAGEGLQGASAARFLLKSERAILDRYRSKTL